MRSRVLIDFAFIILIYGIYCGVMFLLYPPDRLLSPVNPEYLPLIVLGVSLLALFAWYAIGEWGIRAHAGVGAWYTTWFLLLALIVVTAAVVTVIESGLFHAANSNTDYEPVLHFVGGIGAFYVSSVLFSPTNAKFLIWPARYVRTW